MTDTSGFFTTFVASSLPPSPVSSIRKSDFVFENFRNAAAVINSKIVIGSPLFTYSHSSNISASESSSISS